MTNWCNDQEPSAVQHESIQLVSFSSRPVVACGLAWKPQPPPFTSAFGVALTLGGSAIAFEIVRAHYLEGIHFFVVGCGLSYLQCSESCCPLWSR